MTIDHRLSFSTLFDALDAEEAGTPPGPRAKTAMLDLAPLRILLDNGREEVLRREWLNPEERKTLQRLRHEKRRLQWLGGRICAKQAALRHLAATMETQTLDAPRLEIRAAASGRPFVHSDALPPTSLPWISISHSEDRALAVAAACPCGIDIQIRRATLIRVRERFCLPSEERLLNHHLSALPPVEQLALLWAAKEAVKKAAILERMPGFLELELSRIHSRPGIDGHLFTLHHQPSRRPAPCLPAPVQVSLRLCQGYATGLCLLPDQADTGGHHA